MKKLIVFFVLARKMKIKNLYFQIFILIHTLVTLSILERMIGCDDNFSLIYFFFSSPSPFMPFT